MARNVTLSVTGSLDDSVALGALLDTGPDLRGHVRRAVAQVPEGALSGGLPDLLIALGSSGQARRWQHQDHHAAQPTAPARPSRHLIHSS